MSDKKKVLEKVPKRRLHPTDGLAVTAKVWATAHDYHRQRLEVHQALAHAPGVLLGLNVIASDPPDSTLYILPGVALTPSGEFIVVDKPVTYDLGDAEGALTLWLTYAEGPPHSESDPETGEIAYVPAQFGVEAQPGHVTVAGVELARVRRTTGEAPLTNAKDAAFPAPNEIDLRFRREPRPPLTSARLAVSRWSADAKEVQRPYAAGAKALAQALRHAGHTPLWVDVNVPLDGGLNGYTALYLVAEQTDVETETLNALYEYLQAGGTVFIEVGVKDEDGAVEAAVFNALASLAITLTPPEDDHPLLTTPHLFAGLPGTAPVEPDTATLLVGKGVVFSRGKVGPLWGGQGDAAPVTRAEIRAAHEWGENLIRYALRRRHEA
ncbi:MAG: hypothetical protein ACP5HM_13585 [Anaerolineae bacterium]